MKLLATLLDNTIAPRFDLTAEVMIAECKKGKMAAKPRMVLLPTPSADELCTLILKENIGVVICGGIEESHFQYLSWKKIRVIDRVVGPWRLAVERALANTLRPGDIIPET